ncbi:MAG: Rieske (2Fe-2S) protein [Bacteriovoracales bacterium]|nr:Rieske (2Fe-2S) protein [Bacteriovoracales bacterium]
MNPSRRQFFKNSSRIFLAAAIVAPLGMFGQMVIRFLYPKKRSDHWFFVSTTAKFEPGKSTTYKTPEGQSVIISRVKETGTVDDFIALSNVCPHLGCKVHWQGDDKTFFCPCHNGKFSALGKPLTGPPAKANQELIQFPLKIEKGLLYIRVPSESLFRISKLNSKHRGCTNQRRTPA